MTIPTNKAPVWILGLPFDVMTLEDAADCIHESIAKGRKLNFVTPNLSFLREAGDDRHFEKAILSTDLSLADGMPVVWLARLLGVSQAVRVAGSDLFEHISHPTSEADISVFFFGGPEGVSEKACAKINKSADAMRCVGSLYPGYGDIKALSSDNNLQRINAAKADFVVVSLGAKKGIQWIDKNAGNLNAPVISHLGAVVNFVAGSVSRSPLYLQRIGLEWAWRILQERNLASRYVRDFQFLANLLLKFALPIFIKRKVINDQTNRLVIKPASDPRNVATYELKGALTHKTYEDLDVLLSASSEQQPITLDVRELNYIDAYGLGLLYHLKYRRGLRVSIERVNSALRNLIKLHRAELLFK